jgi:hypothetical protein
MIKVKVAITLAILLMLFGCSFSDKILDISVKNPQVRKPIAKVEFASGNIDLKLTSTSYLHFEIVSAELEVKSCQSLMKSAVIRLSGDKPNCTLLPCVVESINQAGSKLNITLQCAEFIPIKDDIYSIGIILKGKKLDSQIHSFSFPTCDPDSANCELRNEQYSILVQKR